MTAKFNRELFRVAEISGRHSGILSKVAILFLLAAVVLVDFLNSFSGSTNYRLVFGSATIVCLMLSQHARGLLKEPDRFVRNLALAALAFIIISLLASSALTVSNYYLCLLTAIVIYRLDYRFFLKTAIALLFINVAIQSYEYWSHQYMYTYVTKEGLDLTEEVWSGGTNIFRAKGLFASPATAADLGIGVALLCPNKVFILLMAIIAATLANGRLTIFVIAAVLVVQFYSQLQSAVSGENREHRRYAVVMLMVFILATVFTYMFYSNDPFALDRLTESWSAENMQNVQRMAFWVDGINFYSNYSIVHKLLGYAGAWTRATGYGGAESDWLTLLIDTGIVGTLTYFIPFVYLAYQAWQLDKTLVIYMGILGFVLAVNPFVLVPTGGVLYWIFVLRARDHLKGLAKGRTKVGAIRAGLPTTVRECDSYFATENP